MGAKYARYDKKTKFCEAVGIDAFIERLKKVRALNCNPSDVGMDDFVLKRLFSGRSNLLTKL